MPFFSAWLVGAVRIISTSEGRTALRQTVESTSHSTMTLQRSACLCVLVVIFLSGTVVSQHLTEKRPPANQTGNVNIEHLVIAWEQREIEIETFYTRYPDVDSEPDPHSVAHLNFEELRKATEESDHDYSSILRNLESHHLTCRKDWLTRQTARRPSLDIAEMLKQRARLPSVAEKVTGQLGRGGLTGRRVKRQTGGNTNSQQERNNAYINMLTEDLRSHTVGLIMEMRSVINETLEQVSGRTRESWVVISMINPTAPPRPTTQLTDSTTSLRDGSTQMPPTTPQDTSTVDISTESSTALTEPASTSSTTQAESVTTATRLPSSSRATSTIATTSAASSTGATTASSTSATVTTYSPASTSATARASTTEGATTPDTTTAAATSPDTTPAATNRATTTASTTASTTPDTTTAAATSPDTTPAATNRATTTASTTASTTPDTTTAAATSPDTTPAATNRASTTASTTASANTTTVSNIMTTTTPASKYANLCPPLPSSRRKRSITNTISMSSSSRSQAHDTFREKRSLELNIESKDPTELLSRKKRLVTSDERREWPFGIVPYMFGEYLPLEERRGIEQAMATFEKLTCMRFVLWRNISGVTTNDLLELGHQGYLRFIDEDGCYSYVGNMEFPEGQEISCYCGRTSCLHELGHAFGFKHEHSSPLRDDWITVYGENVPFYIFRNFEKVTSEEVITFGYDLYSIMHYPVGRYRSYDNDLIITLHNPELPHSRNSHHYMFMELERTQKCTGKSCRDARLNCQNDGYVSFVDGECACICPRGLDPKTGCTTIRRPGDVSLQFPMGQYALPSPREGCPHAEFQFGKRTHTGGGYNAVYDYLLEGNVTRNTAEHITCSNDGTVGAAKTEWSIGTYCIYRVGGTCPPNFREGYIQYADRSASSETRTVEGVLPDGRYLSTSTRFYFCCREDGFAADEIFLPNQAPLALFKFGDACQEIFGMRSSIGTLRFRNDDGYPYSRTADIGENPLTSRSTSTSYYVDHCHYTPVNMSCGGIIHLTPENDNVTLTSNGGKDLLCHWLITAPENDNILLTFDELNLRSASGSTECLDALEARFLRIGSPGLVLCDETEIRSVKSYENKLMLTFNTSGESNSSFTATARILYNSNSCYLKSDKGQSYGGFVNYTRTMRPCLPWSAVGHCQHHRLSLRDMTANLDGNYCRNPDSGIAPWCYFDAEDCKRDYCDVCYNEPRFDYYSDCRERKATGYCRKYPDDALYNCASTCADQILHAESPVPVNTVSCSTPTPPSDGEVTSPTKVTYRVGEKVTFKCKTSTVTVQTVCLTTGRWSEVSAACSVCQDGWAEHEGFCYGYFPQEVNFETAKSTCSEFNGGSVATAKDSVELYFVDFIRDQMNFGESVWLGMSDAEVEGRWRWLDDGQLATWTKWGTDEPDDFGPQGSDCAVMYISTYWFDISCEEKFATVCKAKANEVPCADVWEDCGRMFYDQPTMCEDHPQVAKSKCKFTCGFCGETKCVVELPTENARLDSFSSALTSTINQGKNVRYTCNSGYIPLSGQPERGCQWCGSLTGEPYVCVSREDARNPMTLPTLYDNYSLVGSDIAYTGNNSNFRIRGPGRIVAWEYESFESRDMSFMVWTPTYIEHRFIFKGSNSLRTRRNTLTTYYVPEQEIISVEAVDVIGIYYGAGRGGVPYDICSSYYASEAGNVFSYRPTSSSNSASPFFTGQSYWFSSSSSSCRAFGFRGVIEP